jgi:hypothetical protein
MIEVPFVEIAPTVVRATPTTALSAISRVGPRFVAWVSAGVLAAGLTAATLTGAAVAFAQDASTSDAGAKPTSESSNSPGAQAGSDGAKDESDDADAGENAGAPEDQGVTDEETPEAEVSVGEGATVEEPVKGNSRFDDPVDKKDSAVNDRAVTDTRINIFDAPDETKQKDLTPTIDEIEVDGAETGSTTVDSDSTLTSTVDDSETAFDTEPDDTAHFAMFAVEEEQEQAAPARPTLINVLGTIAWSLLDFVIKTAVGGLPAVPPGSTVTAGRSLLEIDCGDGYTAEADWYYPKEGQPEKLIYFQHGFPARAGIYNLTLTELAERNNAIVVAPSITANYFACDGCSLTADPMHEAVAQLFTGDRAALLASAEAAGFEGTLPTKFVFAGQSAGAMLAAGASGYYYKAATAGKKADMVGVLLFDGSAANGALGRALDKLPAAVPVLHIAGEPALINNFGDANKVLAEKRAGQFNGVQLINGAHSDAFQSDAYFGLVQAFVGLAFGASTPENVEAVHVLSQGWLTDMYAGRVYNTETRTGIYGAPGLPGQTVIDIPTVAGLARGYVLPGPTPAPSAIERFLAALLQSINSNDYVTCSTEATAASCSASSMAV